MATMIVTGSIKLVNSGQQSDRCDSFYLHQKGIVIFDRSEDADSVVKITAEGSKVTTEVVPSHGSGNPSSRRDGLAIQFWCEGCGGGKSEDTIELTIAQRKGMTEMAWRFTPLQPHQNQRL
jgi:hypothetical protein